MAKMILSFSRGTDMITVHHLNDSRSQRILWLLEELSVPYEIKMYQREPKTNLAPSALKSVHPLGKSPVITYDGLNVAESGAIIDYIVRRHGDGRLVPPTQTRAYDEYVQWLHYAEGSAMLPLIMKGTVSYLNNTWRPLKTMVDNELDNHLGYIDMCLQGQDYLLGDELTAADIQMSFVGELAAIRTDRTRYPSLDRWVHRFQARPAYLSAIEKGGTYRLAG
jgi:glutathione S-transferase